MNVACSAAASQPSQGASASLCAGDTALVTDTYWRAGILGLGPPSMAVANTDSWLAAFFNAYDLPHVFSLQQSCSSGGVLSLGATAGYLAPPVPGSVYWSVPLTCISALPPSAQCSVSMGNAASAIVDSGSTVNSLSSSLFNAVVALLNTPANNIALGPGYTVTSILLATNSSARCFTSMYNISQMNAVATGLNLQLGSVFLSVPAVGSWLAFYGSNGAGYFSYCAALRTAGSGVNVLGWPLLTTFIVSFDLSSLQVGWEQLPSASGCSAGSVSGSSSPPPSPPPLPIQPPAAKVDATPRPDNTLAIGLGVGTPVGIVLFALAIWLVIRCHRASPKSKAALSAPVGVHVWTERVVDPITGKSSYIQTTL